jgi:hypothetical protein
MGSTVTVVAGATALAALLGLSCGSDTAAPVDAGYESGVEMTEVSSVVSESSAPPSPVGVGGLAAYDESIPDGSYDAYELFYDDLVSLSRASDVVFVGRVTGYVEAVLVIPPSVDDRRNLSRVYDGVVFSVEELLAGSLPAGVEQVTVATHALIRNPDGTPRVRISQDPIKMFRDGIERRNLPDGPRYLVYARQEDDPSSVFYRSDLHYFNTSGGAAPVLGGGVLGFGVAPPLSQPVVVSEGGLPEFGDRVLGLDDARDAARVEELIDDPVDGGPVDGSPGDGSGPVGATGDGPSGSTGDGEAPGGTTTTTSSTTTTTSSPPTTTTTTTTTSSTTTTTTTTTSSTTSTTTTTVPQA